MISSLLKTAAGFALLLAATACAATSSPVKIMLLTGQSNPYHDWRKSSPLLKAYLEDAGRFAVDVVTAPANGVEASDFAPQFSAYAAVVLDYETRDWPAAAKTGLAEFVKNGGGLVVLHAADNAFPAWPEFNEMIGIGGWGMTADGKVNARSPGAGLKVRWRDGRTVTDDSPGGYGHPARHDFVIVNRAPEHPITKGLPLEWLHASDEIYSQLRGPAKNVTVLATALADKAKFKNASGENEPVLMTIAYGKGRVFHCTLGHVGPNDKPPYPALQSADFITLVQRGTEWAATGAVTIAPPKDFPSAEKTSVRAE